MKTTYLFYAFMMSALVYSTSIFAQEPTPERAKKQPTPEQRIEWQVERMSKQLLLDDETTAQFVPVYKEYLEALAQCRPAAPDRKQPREKELSDEERDQRMQTRFECQKKRLEVQETYYKKFKAFLTMRQVEKIFNAKPQAPRRAPRHLAKGGAPIPPRK